MLIKIAHNFRKKQQDSLKPSNDNIRRLCRTLFFEFKAHWGSPIPPCIEAASASSSHPLNPPFCLYRRSSARVQHYRQRILYLSSKATLSQQNFNGKLFLLKFLKTNLHHRHDSQGRRCCSHQAKGLVLLANRENAGHQC